jgi:hypothetical protein
MKIAMPQRTVVGDPWSEVSNQRLTAVAAVLSI